jgi:hypothetical protein
MAKDELGNWAGQQNLIMYKHNMQSHAGCHPAKVLILAQPGGDNLCKHLVTDDLH